MMRTMMIAAAATVALVAGAAVAPASAATNTCRPSDKGCTMKWLLTTEHPYFSGVSKKQIQKLGKAACAALDSGASIIEILDVLTDDTGFTEDEATSILAASVVVYCPSSL